MDLISQIFSPSSKQHSFILLTTDYFTKWVEVVPLKIVNQSHAIDFIKKHMAHKFGLPQTITVNQGTVFNGDEVKEFARIYSIQVLNSSTYYAQANGQAESSNKTIKATLSRVIEDNPRDWHELPSKMLWAYRNSKRGSTQASPYELVYGYAAVLSLEVTVRSSKVARHYDIPVDEYNEAMFIELQDVEEKRIDAFNCMIAQKKKIKKIHNKKARVKDFVEGDLVWKTILPLGTKDLEFSKWSPN
ncbi:unnamed protein product [Camellia sinensis]